MDPDKTYDNMKYEDIEELYIKAIASLFNRDTLSGGLKSYALYLFHHGGWSRRRGTNNGSLVVVHTSDRLKGLIDFMEELYTSPVYAKKVNPVLQPRLIEAVSFGRSLIEWSLDKSKIPESTHTYIPTLYYISEGETTYSQTFSNKIG